MGNEADQLGPRLRALRTRRMLTQRELGQLIGVDYRVVQRWERGARHPRPLFQRRLCHALNVTADELLGHAP